MRDDMQVGDGVLFYASNANPSGVTGLARIVRAGYADRFPSRRGTRTTTGQPKRSAIWYMVDVGFVARFSAIVPLES